MQPVLERARVKFTAVRAPGMLPDCLHPSLMGPSLRVRACLLPPPPPQVRTEKADHAFEMVAGMALAELVQVGC